MQNDKTGRGIAINDMVFNVQSEVIRQLAEKESCVIIGRCADYVLREQPGGNIGVCLCGYGCPSAASWKVHPRDDAITLIKRPTRAAGNYTSAIPESAGAPGPATM